jgi:hypothetical protein
MEMERGPENQPAVAGKLNYWTKGRRRLGLFRVDFGASGIGACGGV